MKLLDSRRLTGPSLLLDRAGAVIDVALAPQEAEPAIAAWREEVRRLLEVVGWGGEETAARRFPGGANLAISAPIDCLYAATEVNEWAWTAVETVMMERGDPPETVEAAARLREEIEREQRPALLALREAARARNVSFLFGEEMVTAGLGAGSISWPVKELPDPASVDWSAVHDVPALLVSGTNGKTTTVRLLAAMLEAEGKVVGVTSTDHIAVGDETLERGDFSGPSGARMLLRDRRVEVAVLETARGGILRRGLALERAAGAVVTNIASDHLWDYGIHDLPSMAATKLVVARAVRPDGRVVLNADDPELVRADRGFAAPVVWFSLDPRNPLIREHLAAGGSACLLEANELILLDGGERRPVIGVNEVPVTFGGTARYNVANALAAVGLATAAGVPVEAMAEGLRRFRSDPQDNPGRGNLIERDGIRLLVDYAHNPHGLAAILNVAAALPAGRRLLLLGQAGDRDDAAIRDLARAAWSFRPDRIVIKELPEMLRGRQPGEVPAILEDELSRLGAPLESLGRADSELEGVRQALAWALPGDLLVLLVHTQREAVMGALLQEKGEE
ncbi:MAG TPA: Mur ligase family protein [Thermoanaerobaculia bacterium]|nr:Mur ligase family protein [Thermoanaerobaculia bacterium]